MSTGTLALLLAVWSTSQAAGWPWARTRALRVDALDSPPAVSLAEQPTARDHAADPSEVVHEHVVRPAQRLPLDYAPELLGGGALDLAATGGRPVLVQVWSTWCSSCLSTLVELRAVERQWPGLGLQVRLVAVDDDPGPILAHLAEAKVSWPVALDHADSVRWALGATATPTLLVYDAAGSLVWVGEGMVHADDPGLVAALRSLAGQS